MKNKFHFQAVQGAEPLYRQVAEYLKKLIVSGDISYGERLPSEQELAELLSVSRLTLRKGLSILIAQNLIFQVPHHGTFVSEGQNRHLRLGVVWRSNASGTESSYISGLLLAVSQAASAYPDTEIVFINPREKSLRNFADQVAGSRCDGLIVPVGSSDFAAILDDSKFDSLPICYINCYTSSLNGMRYNVTTGENAIRQGLAFLMAHGHRRIAYISQESSCGTLQVRNKNFLENAPSEAISVISKSRSSWFELSRQEVKKLCLSADAPTAILTPGVQFSSGVWHGLVDCGMRIPEDISFLGFDNMDQFFPMLSTLEQPVNDMAAQAVALVHDSALGKVFRNHTYYFEPVIRDRGSVRKI